MEKKEILKWREHLIKMFGVYHSDEMRHTDCPLCGVNLEKISDYMIEEIDKAREEGFGGELVEEARILREQYLEIEEKIRELGRTTKRVQTFVSKLGSK